MADDNRWKIVWPEDFEFNSDTRRSTNGTRGSTNDGNLIDDDISEIFRQRDERRKQAAEAEEVRRILEAADRAAREDAERRKQAGMRNANKTQRRGVPSKLPKMKAKTKDDNIDRTPHANRNKKSSHFAQKIVAVAFVMALSLGVAIMAIKGGNREPAIQPTGIEVAETSLSSEAPEATLTPEATQSPAVETPATATPDNSREAELSQTKMVIDKKYSTPEGNMRGNVYNEDYVLYLACDVLNDIKEEIAAKTDKSRAYRIMAKGIEEGVVSPYSMLAIMTNESDYRNLDKDGKLLKNPNSDAKSIFQMRGMAREDVKRIFGFDPTDEELKDVKTAMELGTKFMAISYLYSVDNYGEDKWNNLSRAEQIEVMTGSYNQGANWYYNKYCPDGQPQPYVYTNDAKETLKRVMSNTNYQLIVGTSGYWQSLKGNNGATNEQALNNLSSLNENVLGGIYHGAELGE